MKKVASRKILIFLSMVKYTYVNMALMRICRPTEITVYGLPIEKYRSTEPVSDNSHVSSGWMPECMCWLENVSVTREYRATCVHECADWWAWTPNIQRGCHNCRNLRKSGVRDFILVFTLQTCYNSFSTIFHKYSSVPHVCILRYDLRKPMCKKYRIWGSYSSGYEEFYRYKNSSHSP
jgi:hypothetical protein